MSEMTELLADARFVAFAALSEARPVGFLEAYIRPFANGCDSRPVPYLEGIWVDPDFRRTGVGSSLLSACDDWARKLGYREIGSDVDIGYAISLASHQAWGFEERERVVCFRKRI